MTFPEQQTLEHAIGVNQFDASGRLVDLASFSINSNNNTAGLQRYPAVATLNNDSVIVVVWQQPDGSGDGVQGMLKGPVNLPIMTPHNGFFG